MEKKLSDLTVIELKSLAYDELARIEQSQSNLRVLNQEINNRVQQSQQTQQESFTAPVSTDGVTDITV
jgi:hypothetical protein